jgi:hypothetical protein
MMGKELVLENAQRFGSDFFEPTVPVQKSSREYHDSNLATVALV